MHFFLLVCVCEMGGGGGGGRTKLKNNVPRVEHLLSPSMVSTAVNTNTNRRRKVKNRSE